jgi:hypothetical protein
MSVRFGWMTLPMLRQMVASRSAGRARIASTLRLRLATSRDAQ